MGTTWSQLFPPTPDLTEKNLPSQKGRVFIVTGGTSGVGYELASILYRAGAKVYLAGRSEANGKKSIDSIKSSFHDASDLGELEYLHLQLNDLSTIKASVEAFQKKESKLDVLWNNAGISMPAVGSKSPQGHELQMATNTLGPFLFTQLLLPSLKAASSAPNTPLASVRVVWTSSQTVDLAAPAEGITMSELDNPPSDQAKNYVNSKTGNWYLASEFGERVKGYGILSLTQNPGNLNSNLMREHTWMKFFVRPLLYPPRMGAYTELWAGLAPELGIENSGAYVVPWGRLHPAPRQDLVKSVTSVDDGGTGRAAEFWAWCEEKIAAFK
jgi:NAD(P)-dependent dehydrogenase (short-subunit alcohol dehydrogenase family)